MGFRIGRTFSFAAAHRINELPDGHKCRRLHGHTYAVEVELSAPELSEPGFVLDFGDLAPVADMIRDRLDHTDLNEVLPVAPTSEHLALYIAEWFIETIEPRTQARLSAVVVRESPATWARWER